MDNEEIKNNDIPCDSTGCVFLNRAFDQNCAKASDEFDNPGIETCPIYSPCKNYMVRDALTRIVNCLETTKANMIERDNLDWFDWCFINQEIKHSKKVLKGGGR